MRLVIRAGKSGRCEVSTTFVVNGIKMSELFFIQIINEKTHLLMAALFE